MEASVEEVIKQLQNQYPTQPAELYNLIIKKVTELQDLNQNTVTTTQQQNEKKKPIRVYVDGCFDIMHSGHYNALRQAKKLGDILVAGVHSDEEILRNKGPTVMKDEERIKLVKACKWVDEVAFGVPYSPTVALLDSLNVDFAVHGDDMPTNAEGKSAYDEVIQAGRCKIIKRTEGVSTTTLVGRLLMMTREHHMPDSTAETPIPTNVVPIESGFLPTSQRIYQFSNFSDSSKRLLYNSNPGKKPQKVVYVDGAFDLFHVGHVEILEKAKQQGDFLLVGIHDDRTVNRYMGKNYPIMNLHERILNVLACKDVDEVILGAPFVITADMIATMNISVFISAFPETRPSSSEEIDPYKIPKEKGIYKELEKIEGIELKYQLTTEMIAERIVSNRHRYEEIFAKKKKKEEDYKQQSLSYRSNLSEL